MTIEFKYAIGDKVKILAIGMTGQVDSLCQDILGQQYRVVYWNNGSRSSTWMYDWEIQPIPGGGKCGKRHHRPGLVRQKNAITMPKL